MRLSTTLWSGLVAGVLLVGLPVGVVGLDGGAIAQTVEERQAEASRLFRKGREQLELGNYQTALELLQQARSIYQELQNGRAVAGSTLLSGYAYAGLGEVERARETFQFLLNVAQLTGFTQLAQDAQQGLRSLEQPNSRGNEPRQAETNRLFQQGIQQFQASEFRAALQSWEQSLSLLQEARNKQGEAQVLGHIGVALYSLGQYEEAIEFYSRSLALNREIGDFRGEMSSLNNLGLAYHAVGRYEQAINLYEISLEIARQISDREGEASSLGNLGIAYHSLSQYEKAIDLYLRALSIQKATDDQRGQARTLGELGRTYYGLAQYRRAIEFHRESLELAQENNDRRGEAASLGNLGIVLWSIGQYDAALEIHQQHLNIAQEIGDLQGQANAFGNLGAIHHSLDQYEQALDFYNQNFDVVKAMGDRRSAAISLNNIGLVYNAMGEYEQAIQSYQKSFEITKEIGDRDLESISLHNFGLALFNLDRAPEAEQQLLAAAEIKESIRADLGDNDTNKVSIFERQSNTYRLLQRAQVAQNKTIAALETAERGRARAFVELLHRRLNPNDPNATIAPPNLAKIQQIAKEQNATLVEYSIIGEESTLYIWVIAPSGDITFRQVDLTSLWRDNNLRLDDLVKCTRDSLGVRGLNLRTLNRLVAVLPRDESRRQCFDDDFLLPKLHELLIAPIADLLPENPEDRVVFVPQSSLFLVPFPALMDVNGDYLIEKHTILTTPSIQTLELTRSQKENQSSGQGALIVGNPTMPSLDHDLDPDTAPEPLTSLPGAETEAIEIANLLNTQAFTGNRATKSAMVAEMQDAEIIHLATHGLLDDIRGMGSAIALAPDANFQPAPGTTNGLLTAEEIFDMDLKADLVVLSACDTGRGRITGDGVVGLSRSFVSAGVPSVLVSLWQVPDAPTAALMTEFYQQRESLGDNAQALRQAMLKTMQTHPEPRNWAAFTLIGEAD